MPKEFQNTGFQPPIESDKDYVFGGTTGVVHEDRLTTGDWRPYTPVGELQRYKKFDDYGCVSHSALNSLEMQGRMLNASNLLRMDDIAWLKDNLYLVNDNWNFDDRFLVVLSGTIPGQGNAMNKPWETARTVGLPAQGATPFHDDMKQEEYYDESDFPASSYVFAKEFKSRFMIQYEKVVTPNDDDLRKALKHAPLQVGLATCPGWFSTGTVHKCSASANHACLLVHVEKDGSRWIFDSYDPFLKKLEPGYPFPFIYKGVLSPVVGVDGTVKEGYIFNKNLEFGAYDSDVAHLWKRLIKEGFMTGYPVPTPHFGPEVKEGLFQYQINNKVASLFDLLWYRGRYFGPRTRAKMNSTNV